MAKGLEHPGASGVDGLGRSTGEAGVLTWEHPAKQPVHSCSRQILEGAAERDSDGFELKRPGLTVFGRLVWLKCGKRSGSPVSRGCAAVGTHRGTQSLCAPSLLGRLQVRLWSRGFWSLTKP